MNEAIEAKNDADAAMERNQEGKYLSFVLGDEEYGIKILSVREIISVIEITAIPNVPAYVKGVINLRGNVIPVVDLRLKFGMSEKEYGKETCTIVVNMADRLMGIIVDTVSEVLDIHDKDIGAPPSFGSSVNTNFILGMGKIKDTVVVLLDIGQVLQSEDLVIIQSSVGTLKSMEESDNV